MKTAEDIRQLNERIAQAGQFTDKLRHAITPVIVGQKHMLDRLLDPAFRHDGTRAGDQP